MYSQPQEVPLEPPNGRTHLGNGNSSTGLEFSLAIRIFFAQDCFAGSYSRSLIRRMTSERIRAIFWLSGQHRQWGKSPLLSTLLFELTRQEQMMFVLSGMIAAGTVRLHVCRILFNGFPAYCLWITLCPDRRRKSTNVLASLVTIDSPCWLRGSSDYFDADDNYI